MSCTVLEFRMTISHPQSRTTKVLTVCEVEEGVWEVSGDVEVESVEQRY